MPKQNRSKTSYVGVYFVEGTAIATGKPERIYYIMYRRDGRLVEEKAGRQFQDNMTPAKASRIRAERIEGKALSNTARREAVEAARRAEESRPTLSRIWAEFKRQKAANKSIYDDKLRWNKHLKAAFGEKTPPEILTLDVDRIRHRLTKSGLAPATVKQVLVLLKRLINFGVKKGICPAPDPQKLNIEMPKVRNQKTEDLTPEELDTLFAALEDESNPQMAGLVRLALFSGLRRGELIRLKWADLDFDRGFLTLRDTKGGGDQRIPMSKIVREILENHPRIPESEYVFPNPSGGQMAECTASQGAKKIRDRAGLPKDFRPLHGLRHSFASALASSGVDLYAIQNLLRHQTPGMTQRYAHLRDQALRGAADVAETAIVGTAKGTEKGKVVHLDNRNQGGYKK